MEVFLMVEMRMKACKTYDDNTNFLEITINNKPLFQKMTHFYLDLLPLKLLAENFKENINTISNFNLLLVFLILFNYLNKRYKSE